VKRAGRLYTATITEIDDPEKRGKKHLHMELSENKDAADWTALQNGCYLLRTNLVDKDPAERWRTYIGLTEAESALRALKSPLGMRPVYHQKTDRVDAHIFTCFLALAMRRTLSLWMKESGLGTAPDKLLAELGENPLSGDLFLFRNRRGDRLKVLHWDRNGYVVWYKRLERGTFSFPPPGEGGIVIDPDIFLQMIGGLRLDRVWKYRKKVPLGA